MLPSLLYNLAQKKCHSIISDIFCNRVLFHVDTLQRMIHPRFGPLHKIDKRKQED